MKTISIKESFVYVAERYKPHWMFKLFGVLTFVFLNGILTPLIRDLWGGEIEFLQPGIVSFSLYAIFGLLWVLLSYLLAISIYMIDVLPLILMIWLSEDVSKAFPILEKGLRELSLTWRGKFLEGLSNPK
jgi:hypothetical protein